MSLDKITKRIISDSERRAAEIKSAAEEEAERIIAEGKKKAAAEKESIVTAGQRDAAILKKQVMATAHLDARNLVLAEKRRAIEESFERAISRLDTMPAKEYRQLLTNMLLEAAEGDEEVVLSESDRKQLGDNWLKETNGLLKKKKKPGNLKFADTTRDIGKGLLLRREGIEMNYSFGAMLGAQREELEPRVVETLFKSND